MTPPPAQPRLEAAKLSPEDRQAIRDRWAATVEDRGLDGALQMAVEALLRVSDLLADEKNEVQHLREALREREQDTQRLLTFAARVTQDVRDGMDVDGGDVQSWATEAGLLVPTTMTTPCEEGCVCTGYGEFPTTCYRDSPQLAAARGVSSGDQPVSPQPTEETE